MIAIGTKTISTNKKKKVIQKQLTSPTFYDTLITIQYCKPRLQIGSHDAVLLTKANNIKPHMQRLF